ncbi:MAG: PorT family protein [Prevotellaceae bacterium]|nr:PorT family protein [Prevotellaceae bacterium]
MKNKIIIILICCGCLAGGEAAAQHFIGVTSGYGINTMSSTRNEDLGNFNSLKNFGLVYKYYSGKWVGIQVGVNYAEKGYMRCAREYYDQQDLEKGYDLVDISSRRFQLVDVPFVTQFHYEVWKIRAMANAGVYGSYILRSQSAALHPDFSPDEFEFNNFDYGLRFGGGLSFMLHPLEIQLDFAYSIGLGYIYDSHVQGYTVYNRLSQMLISATVFFAL